MATVNLDDGMNEHEYETALDHPYTADEAQDLINDVEVSIRNALEDLGITVEHVPAAELALQEFLDAMFSVIDIVGEGEDDAEPITNDEDIIPDEDDNEGLRRLLGDA